MPDRMSRRSRMVAPAYPLSASAGTRVVTRSSGERRPASVSAPMTAETMDLLIENSMCWRAGFIGQAYSSSSAMPSRETIHASVNVLARTSPTVDHFSSAPDHFSRSMGRGRKSFSSVTRSRTGPMPRGMPPTGKISSIRVSENAKYSGHFQESRSMRSRIASDGSTMASSLAEVRSPARGSGGSPAMSCGSAVGSTALGGSVVPRPFSAPAGPAGTSPASGGSCAGSAGGSVGSAWSSTAGTWSADPAGGTGAAGGTGEAALSPVCSVCAAAGLMPLVFPERAPKRRLPGSSGEPGRVLSPSAIVRLHLSRPARTADLHG